MMHDTCLLYTSYGGYSGGYNTGSSCGCSNAMNYSYPSYGYGYGNYGMVVMPLLY